jgi:hypothetical protein
MASLVANAVSPHDALLFGVAHEIDAANAPTYGSVDSCIDMLNDRVGIEIGKEAVRYARHETSSSGAHAFGNYDAIVRAKVQEMVLAGIAPDCRGPLCFDLSSRG